MQLHSPGMSLFSVIYDADKSVWYATKSNNCQYKKFSNYIKHFRDRLVFIYFYWIEIILWLFKLYFNKIYRESVKKQRTNIFSNTKMMNQVGLHYIHSYSYTYTSIYSHYPNIIIVWRLFTVLNVHWQRLNCKKLGYNMKPRNNNMYLSWDALTGYLEFS